MPALLTDVAEPGREADVTVLMTDIRGYTRLVEQLTPAEAVAYLDEKLSLIARPVLAAGGTVDKYIGDGVLAFFEGDRHAERALIAAKAMLAAVNADVASHPERPSWRIGIAVNTGRAMLGWVGPPERREFTVIGDVVNVVSRLEEIAKTYELVLIVSAATVKAAPEGAVGLQGPELQPIRGHAASLEVFYTPNQDILPWE